MESRKMILKNLFTGQQWRHKQRTDLWTWGELEGEGEMYGKNNMETYTTICKIDSHTGICCVAHDTLTGVCINLEGWMGREMGGRFKRKGVYVFLWLIQVEV